jgi:hypothetical protein
VFIAGTEDARGFKQWKEVNRYVKKGAKAFVILAPRFIKNGAKEEEDREKDLSELQTVIFGRMENEGVE